MSLQSSSQVHVVHRQSVDQEDPDACCGLDDNEPVPEIDFTSPRAMRALHDFFDPDYDPDEVKAASSLATALADYPASPELRIALHNSRDARRHGRPRGTLTVAQWRAVCEAWGHRCAYCTGKPKRLTIEHVRPICLGGRTELGNIVPSCGRCNRRKGTLGAQEWLGPEWPAFEAKLAAANAAAGLVAL